MSDMRYGCLGIVLIFLGFFWLVGFIGNHCDWIRAKCNSVSAGFHSARADALECWEAHKSKVAAEKEAERREEENRRIAAEQRRAAEHKEDTLREFALRESPVLWKSVVQMRKDIAEQDARLESLAKSIRDMGEDPESDADYLELGRQHDRMKIALNGVLAKLKDAYIESCKYQATMGQKECSVFKHNATEDGEAEAEAAELRYGEMRKTK